MLQLRVPGTLVPRATNVIAVMASWRPTVQPKCEAISPITAVRTPMHMMESVKHT